ncbi:MAG: SRPBCC family protein, partial [Planctomycetes bacterium]|nr:SRPBCC family protein [Planctomycetota bacterium]
ARIVFDAWTRPEHVGRWWAPKSRGVSFAVCEADVRVGGRYRYVLKRDTGEAFEFSGTYREISPPSRLVYTQAFGPTEAGGAALVTVTFDEREGRTHMVSREFYPSKEALDGALEVGMEDGARESLDQLDELLASLR